MSRWTDEELSGTYHFVADTLGGANCQNGYIAQALGDTQQGKAAAPGWIAAAPSRTIRACRCKSAKAPTTAK